MSDPDFLDLVRQQIEIEAILLGALLEYIQQTMLTKLYCSKQRCFEKHVLTDLQIFHHICSLLECLHRKSCIDSLDMLEIPIRAKNLEDKFEPL